MRPIGEQADEGGQVALTLRQVGTQRNLRELTHGELTVDLEAAYALHLIIEEVQAVGELRGEGIDIHDAPTQGKLPRLIDVVHTLEAPAEELVTELVTLDDAPWTQDKWLFLCTALLGDPFHQRLWIGHKDGEGCP